MSGGPGFVTLLLHPTSTWNVVYRGMSGKRSGVSGGPGFVTLLLHPTITWNVVYRGMSGKRSGVSGGPPWGGPISGPTSGPRMAPMYGMRSGEKSMMVKGAASSSPTRCRLITLRLLLLTTVLRDLLWVRSEWHV